MSESPNTKSSDHRPLTIEHGRKLFAKSVDISEQLNRLMPLLALVEIPSAGGSTDPIQTIVKLLEALSAQGYQVIECLQEIDAKLELLLANSNISEP